jgi:hypothetical protein
MSDLQKSSPSPSRWNRLGIRVFGLGLGGLLLAFLAGWFFLRGLPLSAPPQNSAPASQAQTQPNRNTPVSPPGVKPAPEESTAPLKSELEQVLSGIRDANFQKDLSQLLSHYSPNFPRLTQRARDISKSWKIYDYQKMEFEIGKVKLLSDNTAVARVTWEVEVQNINTRKSKKLSRIYLTRFVKESGRWRLEALEKAK